MSLPASARTEPASRLLRPSFFGPSSALSSHLGAFWKDMNCETRCYIRSALSRLRLAHVIDGHLPASYFEAPA